MYRMFPLMRILMIGTQYLLKNKRKFSKKFISIFSSRPISGNKNSGVDKLINKENERIVEQ